MKHTIDAKQLQFLMGARQFFHILDEAIQAFNWSINLTGEELSYALSWTAKSFPNAPKTWVSQLKKNPEYYFNSGIKKGYITVELEIKNKKEKFKKQVFLSESPEQFVTEQIAKNAGWAKEHEGKKVKIYNPMHQKKPGLGEYLVVAQLQKDSEDFLICSDQFHFRSESKWMLLKMNPESLELKATLDVKKVEKELLYGNIGEPVSISGLDYIHTKIQRERIESMLFGYEFSGLRFMPPETVNPKEYFKLWESKIVQDEGYKWVSREALFSGMKEPVESKIVSKI